MNYVGLDAHSRNFIMQPVNDKGKKGLRFGMTTSAENLIRCVRKIPKPRIVVVEECHLAQWIKNTLEEECDQFIICDPKENKRISQAEYINDKNSALILADLLRGGYIKAIHHPDAEGAKRRELYLLYYNLVRQTARIKLKLKAVFRRVAIVPSQGYSPPPVPDG